MQVEEYAADARRLDTTGDTQEERTLINYSEEVMLQRR